jgi:hypothetical protein
MMSTSTIRSKKEELSNMTKQIYVLKNLSKNKPLNSKGSGGPQ